MEQAVLLAHSHWVPGLEKNQAAPLASMLQVVGEVVARLSQVVLLAQLHLILDWLVVQLGQLALPSLRLEFVELDLAHWVLAAPLVLGVLLALGRLGPKLVGAH